MDTNAQLKSYLQETSFRNAVWRDDGHTIAYISTRDETIGIWETNLDTGTHRRLSNENERIWSLTSDPKTGILLYTVDIGGNEREQIYAIAPGREPRNLTQDPASRHYLGGVRADGKSVVYSSNRRSSSTFDIWAVDMESGSAKLLYENTGNYNTPAHRSVSPNGAYALYNKLNGSSDNMLWMLDMDAGKASQVPGRAQTAQYIHPVWRSDSAGFYCISDADSEFCYVAYYHLATGSFTRVYETNWDVETIDLSGDDRYLAMVVNEDGYSALRVLDTQTQALCNPPLPPKGVISPYDVISFSPTGHQLLFSLTSGQRLQNIWLLDLDAESLRRVTDGQLDGIAQSELIEPQLHHYASFDGLSVPFWLYTPHGKPAENLPVVIEIHGGPEGQELPAYDAFLQYLTARGIAVVAPNIRGSVGYGKTYHHLDDVEKRLDSVRDIEALVAHLISSGIAHRESIAVTGASYGGFMALSCAARLPGLWACAVDMVGMYNLESFLENTAPYRRAHREAEYGSLEHHRDILREVSPIQKSDAITAPLMVVHGANDPRVPVTEAEQVVKALQNRGLPVTYLRYEDEGHGIIKLSNKLDCYPKIAAFLEQNLGLLP